MSEFFALEDSMQKYLLTADQDILQHISSTDKVPVDTRLAIYRDAYRSRLHEALTTSYPVLQAHLGENEFQEVAYAYIDASPSEYRSIRWFGDTLSDFLSDTPALAELAKFEWVLGLVFDAADAPILTVEEISQIPSEKWIDMQLFFHPSVHRFASKWNTVEIWQAYTEEQNIIQLVQNVTSIEWILWRKDDMNQFASLSIDEAWALDAIQKGATFGEICEGLCEWVEEESAAMHAASLLKGWLMSELMTSVKIVDTSI